MRYLLLLVLLTTCATSALAETGRGWSPWYKLDDGGLNGIEFSHKNDCQPGGTASCDLQWRFSSGYETPVEIEYTIAWESGGPQKMSERVKIEPGINVSDAFTVKGSALDEVSVRLISDKKILAEARKEVTAELKRQEDEHRRKVEAARLAELARKAEQARQEKLARAAVLPYKPGEPAEVTQFREKERLAEERRQERERLQRAEVERQAQVRRDEEERQAQIRRDKDEEYAQQKRDEEREAREWEEKYAAHQEEGRQSTREAWAGLGRHIQLQGADISSTMANIDRQTNAAIKESNRVLAAQAAERERARAEREEREADRRRDVERDRVARVDAQRSAETQRAQENERIRQQEEARREKQARQQEQAQLQEQALQKEQARKQELVRKKAEAEKSKLAEQQAEEQARVQYLQKVAAGTRLVATKCPDGEGQYYATGTMPNIKPEVVGCVDVHFRAYCGDSPQYSDGIAKNFLGMSGCFGDTYDINPKPNCKVEQVRIEVVKAQRCAY